MDKQNKRTNKGVVITFIIGLIALVAGVAILIVNLTARPSVADATYLVEVGTWTRKDEPSVIWEFTEVGSGKLTVNNHQNDYDFIWDLAGETLEIETDWLMKLNDSYTYKVDQEARTLTLTNGSESWVFVGKE